MLKLTDDGAKITLQGQPPAGDNGLFWFGSALLVGAVAVVLAMSLLPERLSIGALALLIIGSFFFNRLFFLLDFTLTQLFATLQHA